MSEASAIVKKCPYCGEENPADAIVCTHCGRDLARQPKKPPLIRTLLGMALAMTIIGACMTLRWGWITFLSFIFQGVTYFGYLGCRIAFGILLVVLGRKGLISQFQPSPVAMPVAVNGQDTAGAAQGRIGMRWIMIGLAFGLAGLCLLYFPILIENFVIAGFVVLTNWGALPLVFLSAWRCWYMGLPAIQAISALPDANKAELRPWKIIAVAAPILVLVDAGTLLMLTDLMPVLLRRSIEGTSPTTNVALGFIFGFGAVALLLAFVWLLILRARSLASTPAQERPHN